MKDIVILGAGRIGRAVAFMLGGTGEYRLRIGDADQKALEQSARGVPNASTQPTSFDSQAELDRILSGAAAVISCAPFACNLKIAERAREKRVHYFDLTEDVAVTKKVKELASGAASAFVPQCGLAPGVITIIATSLLAGLSEVKELKLRVGALPRRPTRLFHYNLTWSTNGLVNEYCNPCEAIVDGQPATVQPLEGLESLTLDGVCYEAFHTSGGLGTLMTSLAGKVRNLDYKTIRYPGHNLLLRFLLHDLGFAQHREELARILERAVPATLDDQCVIFASATGMEHGRLVERTWSRTITDRTISGQRFGAIQVTTAAGVCAVADLLLAGKLPQKGLVTQEQVEAAAFFGNRFGQYFAS